ncbi:MAG: hypothetical protein KAU28_04700, partial [Phycisphaerae bacterium]|nr:hypothetical protein [Phycisphaerae bacterium]
TPARNIRWRDRSPATHAATGSYEAGHARRRRGGVAAAVVPGSAASERGACGIGEKPLPLPMLYEILKHVTSAHAQVSIQARRGAAAEVVS